MELIHRCSDTQSPLGLVVLAHGYAEHSGRFTRLHEELLSAGFDIVYGDFPGHGTAPGPRAQVDVGSLIRLHANNIEKAERLRRGGKLFTFGHSMGGLITAGACLITRTSIDGMVLTGPGFRPIPTLPLGVVKAALPLARLFPGLPSAPVTSSEEKSLLSRDPQVQRGFNADPLCYHGPVPLLTGATISMQGHEVLTRADQVSTPLLIIHAELDALTDPEASIAFVEASRLAGNTDATVHIISGARHEVLNELEADESYRLIIDWLVEHA